MLFDTGFSEVRPASMGLAISESEIVAIRVGGPAPPKRTRSDLRLQKPKHFPTDLLGRVIKPEMASKTRKNDDFDAEKKVMSTKQGKLWHRNREKQSIPMPLLFSMCTTAAKNGFWSMTVGNENGNIDCFRCHFSF